MAIRYTFFRRLASVAFAILMVAALVACSDTNSSTDTTPSAPAGSTPLPNPAETTADTEAPASTVPDFTVIDTDGKAVRLSDLVGKPVILNCWASWCPPCKAEMPDFEEIYKQYGDRVHFMIVNLTDGQRETVDTAKAYVAAQGYTFPIYFDTTMDAANTYRVSSIPTTYFINADGTLLSYANGMLDAETLEKQLQILLGE